MKTKEIISNISQRLGIERLNPMQQTMAQTDARSIILLAPTGSGKTLAFTIAMLRNVPADAVGVSALVLAPSRELVLQITDVVRAASAGLKVAALYGGHNVTDEVNTLSVAPDIIVATPGRMLDHIKRGNINLDTVHTLVLDEYDKSLELGFVDQMRRIVKRLPHVSLRILTSATRLDEFPAFVGKESDYTVIDTLPTADTPRHRTTVVEVPSSLPDKLDTLTDLLRALDNQKVIVFVNHRESAERVALRLADEGMPVGLYHGGLEQQQRRHAVEMLENGTTPILVATDLAARGLDISDVGAIVHYHLPADEAVWTHRNGRTARQSATGTVYAITSDNDSIPEFISFDRQFVPKTPSANPIMSTTATLYIDAGKKEKISKADIVGFLVKQCGLNAGDIGRITLDDHSAIVAVPTDSVDSILASAAASRMKNRRVRLSRLLPSTTPTTNPQKNNAPFRKPTNRNSANFNSSINKTQKKLLKN